jgi:hypothetical protein
MAEKKPRKSTPELIDLPEDTLDVIKSRISTGCPSGGAGVIQ